MLNDHELLFTVNDKNEPIDPLPRYVVHRDGILHRTSHIWVYNSQRQILCQQRSLLKDKNAGLWEPFFGGHLAPGQAYIAGALAELGEEIGIAPQQENLQAYKIHHDKNGFEFQGVFLYKWDGDVKSLKLEADEVEQVAFIALDEVQVAMEKKDTHWSIASYAVEILRHIKELS